MPRIKMRAKSFFNGSPYPDYALFGAAVLAVVNLCTKFGNSTFIPFQGYEGRTKI